MLWVFLAHWYHCWIICYDRGIMFVLCCDPFDYMLVSFRYQLGISFVSFVANIFSMLLSFWDQFKGNISLFYSLLGGISGIYPCQKYRPWKQFSNRLLQMIFLTSFIHSVVRALSLPRPPKKPRKKRNDSGLLLNRSQRRRRLGMAGNCDPTPSRDNRKT